MILMDTILIPMIMLTWWSGDIRYGRHGWHSVTTPGWVKKDSQGKNDGQQQQQVCGETNRAFVSTSSQPSNDKWE